MMSYQNVASGLSVVVTVVAGLGCCCPARFAAPIGAPRAAPIVVQQQGLPQAPAPNVPVPNVPVPNLPAPQLTADMQRFVAENLAPNTQAGSLAANSALWGTLKQKVAGRQYVAQPMIGGGFGQVDFADAHPEGGVLIGFFAGEDGQGHVGFLQPIYLTAAGEKTGLAYGAVRQPLRCLKAKSGYAVGGLNIRVGGVMDACAVVFAKVDGEKLNPADRYSSVLLGGQGGGPQTTSATNLVIGIYGKRLERDAFAPAGAVTGIGFLAAP